MAVTRHRSGLRGRAALAGAVALAAVVGIGDGGLASAASAGGGGASLAVGRAQPVRSIAPSAAFARYCFAPGRTAACNAAALADIDLARRAEHLAPLVLPSNFASRRPLAQLGIIVNLERAARHLPVMAMRRPLDVKALAGAEAGTDPTGPSGFTWGSNLAAGYATPLAADFGWMYDDGVGSPNTACTSIGQPGCWAHRRNILAPWAGTQGGGVHVNSRGTVIMTQLFVAGH